ncbi:hypothetical protein RFI_03978 [Reticulomyxa filosa]|uniref:Uncharacterized protein n=1 Tax=Reticulomyxa filosa TaxID=46433 RepID=X6P4S9_RETFI|nr:hypothetical protein RFI_03978 [Reticulomyxa filosa]|eukprot:ETO33128.1 hypothetical protein RFI_03978 [Reticulomyxa filosa]
MYVTPINKQKDFRNVDQALYNASWSIQNLFRDPRSVLSTRRTDEFKTFKDNLRTVLDYFEQNRIQEMDALQHYKSKEESNGAWMLDDMSNGNFKYLTNCNLFALQLSDPTIRRNILVQTLIFCHSHIVVSKTHYISMCL